MRKGKEDLDRVSKRGGKYNISRSKNKMRDTIIRWQWLVSVTNITVL